MLKQSLLACAFMLASSSAYAVPLFSDNFDGEIQALNSTLSNWSVTSGSVDTIGPGFFDFYIGNGNYIDMNGSTSQGGRIESTSLSLNAGSYELSFNVGINTFGFLSTEDLLYGIVGGPNGSLTVARPDGGVFQTVTFAFTLLTAGSYNLFFQDGGLSDGDNGGAILDNVQLSAVPLPAALPLFAGGLAMFGAVARRRKKAKA